MGYLIVLALAVALSAVIVAITTFLLNVVIGAFHGPYITFWVCYAMYSLFFIVRVILKGTFRIKE